jgi:hypothetical protein
MTKQIVNIGNIANDKTGDPLRTAFTKINENFDEVYDISLSAVQPGDLATVATTGAYADLSGLPVLFDGAYSSLSGIPTEFTPAAHTHVIGDVTGLQNALDAKVTGTGITIVQALTQAQYDLLSPPVATTLYVITDAA